MIYRTPLVLSWIPSSGSTHSSAVLVFAEIVAVQRGVPMEGSKYGQESDEFYGDSDADENPFAPDEPTSRDGIDCHRRHPNNITLSATNLASDRSDDGLNNSLATSATTPAGGELTTAEAMPPLLHYWQQGFPGNHMPAMVGAGQPSFPPPVSLNGPPQQEAHSRPNTRLGDIMVARRMNARLSQDAGGGGGVDVMGEEVETETEGETECDDSESDEGGLGGRGGDREHIGTSSKLPAEEWAASEEDWVALVDAQLRTAQDGQADPHAMRLLLRKAGFVPPSRRKDVWRLLILGRVEPGTQSSTATEYPDSTSEILALEAAILCTDLDLDNQRVVRVDVERTRPALEQFKRPRVKNLLARVLTHHCKNYGLGYRQVRYRVSFLWGGTLL